MQGEGQSAALSGALNKKLTNTRNIKMHANQTVEWSEPMPKREVVHQLLYQVIKGFLEPRGVPKSDHIVHLLAAANNYLFLLDKTQEALKTHFSKIEWRAIEMAIAEATEGNLAGPSLVGALDFEFSTNVEIKRLGLDLPRTTKKLEKLTRLERDAIADAGRKSRNFPNARLFDLLGTTMVQT
jgi:hypothetical protein